jgi:hypothetical protein
MTDDPCLSCCGVHQESVARLTGGVQRAVQDAMRQRPRELATHADVWTAIAGATYQQVAIGAHSYSASPLVDAQLL